eukprot:234527_1
MTATAKRSSFVKLKDPPKPFPLPTFDYYISPLYYFDTISNGNFIFVISDHGIIKYNLDQQIVAEQYLCPPNIVTEWIEPYWCLDNKNGKIYITNHPLDLYDLHQFVTLNINTKQFQTQKTHIDMDCANLVFIPSPINHIHVLDHDDCNHYKFDITNKEIIETKTNSELQKFLEYNNIFHPKLFYVKFHPKKLYLFGGNKDNAIFEYDNNEWNISKLKMPFGKAQ